MSNFGRGRNLRLPRWETLLVVQVEARLAANRPTLSAYALKPAEQVVEGLSASQQILEVESLSVGVLEVHRVESW